MGRKDYSLLKSNSLKTLMQEDNHPTTKFSTTTTTTTKTIMSSLFRSTPNDPTCQALITQRDAQLSQPRLSYFLNITIPSSKLRIKIPKLLAKSVKKNPNGKKPKKLGHPKSLTSLFSNTFGGSKKPKTRVTSGFNPVPREEEYYKTESSVEYYDSFRSTLTMSSIRSGMDSIILETSSSSLSEDFHSLRKDSEIDEEEEEEEEDIRMKLTRMGLNGKSGNEICMACKRPLKRERRIMKLFKPLKFSFSGRRFACGSKKNLDCPSRTSSSGSLSLKRFLVERKGWKLGKYGKKGDTRKGGEVEMNNEEDESDLGLCSKKILMGEKCRPLNI